MFFNSIVNLSLFLSEIKIKIFINLFLIISLLITFDIVMTKIIKWITEKLLFLFNKLIIS